MKKNVLIVLVLSMSLMLFAGCGDGKKDSSHNDGMYEVTFFGSQVTNASGTGASLADMFYISNNCAEAQVLYPNIVNQGGKNGCTDQSQVRLMKGLVAIQIKDGKAIVTSKMEMKGGAVDMSTADKYQFTEYAPVDYTGYPIQGAGVLSYNYDADNNTPSATAFDSPTSPFKITKNGDNIDIEMTLIDKSVPLINATVDAVTRVQAHRVGDYAPLTNEVDVDLTVTP